MKINSTWTSFWTFANRRNRCTVHCAASALMLQINVSKYQSIYMIQNIKYALQFAAMKLQMIFNESDYIYKKKH